MRLSFDQRTSVPPRPHTAEPSGSSERPALRRLKVVAPLLPEGSAAVQATARRGVSETRSHKPHPHGDEAHVCGPGPQAS